MKNLGIYHSNSTQVKSILGCLQVYRLYSGFQHHPLESLISTMVSISFPPVFTRGFNIQCLPAIDNLQVNLLELCGGLNKELKAKGIISLI